MHRVIPQEWGRILAMVLDQRARSGPLEHGVVEVLAEIAAGVDQLYDVLVGAENGLSTDSRPIQSLTLMEGCFAGRTVEHRAGKQGCGDRVRETAHRVGSAIEVWPQQLKSVAARHQV